MYSLIPKGVKQVEGGSAMEKQIVVREKVDPLNRVRQLKGVQALEYDDPLESSHDFPSLNARLAHMHGPNFNAHSTLPEMTILTQGDLLIRNKMDLAQQHDPSLNSVFQSSVGPQSQHTFLQLSHGVTPGEQLLPQHEATPNQLRQDQQFAGLAGETNYVTSQPTGKQ